MRLPTGPPGLTGVSPDHTTMAPTPPATPRTRKPLAGTTPRKEFICQKDKTLGHRVMRAMREFEKRVEPKTVPAIEEFMEEWNQEVIACISTSCWLL